MTKIRDLHKRWMKDPQYTEEYNALEEEFALAAAVLYSSIMVSISAIVRARGSTVSTYPLSAITFCRGFTTEGATGTSPFKSEGWLTEPLCESCANIRPPAEWTASVILSQAAI